MESGGFFKNFLVGFQGPQKDPRYPAEVDEKVKLFHVLLEEVGVSPTGGETTSPIIPWICWFVKGFRGLWVSLFEVR